MKCNASNQHTKVATMKKTFFVQNTFLHMCHTLNARDLRLTVEKHKALTRFCSAKITPCIEGV